MGADCTGIDLSEEGIKLAKELNKELGMNSNFLCCNVLDVSKHLNTKFDIVFTSYGTIGWLPDLKPWAQMISERLKKGGIFYIVDFHPIVWMFDYTSKPLPNWLTVTIKKNIFMKNMKELMQMKNQK